MRGDGDFDPVDAVVRDALRGDGEAARRVVSQALAAGPSAGRLMVPALVGFAVIIAAAIGLTRYASGEPPTVIRGEGSTIVIESGSRRNRTIETLRDDQPRGGVVVIREGGD